MLGVYNCPLIHLGDLIPILNLIYEINEERKRRNAAPISAFDFYPSFHRGLTVGDGQHPKYGISADSMDLDIVQRGVYTILLKSLLKARQMNLGLLFEPDQALRQFLFRLPNPPLSMPSFFDGVYRCLEHSGASDDMTKRRAMFDLTKPIRLGLETNLDDEKWYLEEMGCYLPFCSSCGYEMLFELFPAGTRRVDPHRRVCAGCSLQNLFDNEPHDMRPWKIALLSTLMPRWHGTAHNPDAPIHADAHGLMKLISTWRGDEHEHEHAKAATLQAPNGSSAAGPVVTPHVIPLRRDNKMHADSLSNLPSLEELVTRGGATLWGKMFDDSHRADWYARARQRTQVEAGMSRRNLPADAYGEVWARTRHAREVQSHEYISAIRTHQVMEAMGW